MRIKLIDERIVDVELGECFVGGLNWPCCAAGVWPHRECVEHWLRGERTAERPLDPAKTFWPFDRRQDDHESE